MGIERPAGDGGVTLETVPLRVTRDAGFQTLSRRLSMPGAEGSIRVVVSRIHRPTRYQSGLLMAAGAELRVVVAVAAIGFSGVSRGRVASQESRSVIACRV